MWKTPSRLPLRRSRRSWRTRSNFLQSRREYDETVNSGWFLGVQQRLGLGYTMATSKLTWQSANVYGTGSGGNPPGDANIVPGAALITYMTIELGATYFGLNSTGSADGIPNELAEGLLTRYTRYNCANSSTWAGETLDWIKAPRGVDLREFFW